jgi:co-chaperonin GroES (HSP10)
MAETPEQARQRMLDEVTPLMEASGLQAVGNNILVMVYDRAGQKTAGGLYVPDSHREDEFQGKIGLVLGVGPMCNDDAASNYSSWFGGEAPKAGDWVGISIRDGLAVKLGKHTCRLVRWDLIQFVVSSPHEVE